MPGPREVACVALLVAVLAACQPAVLPAPSQSSAATQEPPTAAIGGSIASACAALHWYDVRSALEAADHYTYRTDDRIVDGAPGTGSVAAQPVDLARVAMGAYLAPDRMSEMSTWTPIAPAASSGLASASIAMQYPDFIQVGSQGWERIPTLDPVWHAGLRMPDQRGGHLRSILVQLAATAPWSAGRPDPSVPDSCVFSDSSVTGADGTRFDATLWADPVTSLPTHLHVDRVGRTGPVSRFDTVIDPAAAAAIEPPAVDVQAGSPRP